MPEKPKPPEPNVKSLAQEAKRRASQKEAAQQRLREMMEAREAEEKRRLKKRIIGAVLGVGAAFGITALVERGADKEEKVKPETVAMVKKRRQGPEEEKKSSAMEVDASVLDEKGMTELENMAELAGRLEEEVKPAQAVEPETFMDCDEFGCFLKMCHRDGTCTFERVDLTEDRLSEEKLDMIREEIERSVGWAVEKRGKNEFRIKPDELFEVVVELGAEGGYAVSYDAFFIEGVYDYADLDELLADLKSIKELHASLTELVEGEIDEEIYKQRVEEQGWPLKEAKG